MRCCSQNWLTQTLDHRSLLELTNNFATAADNHFGFFLNNALTHFSDVQNFANAADVVMVPVAEDDAFDGDQVSKINTFFLYQRWYT